MKRAVVLGFAALLVAGSLSACDTTACPQSALVVPEKGGGGGGGHGGGAGHSSGGSGHAAGEGSKGGSSGSKGGSAPIFPLFGGHSTAQCQGAQK